MAQHGIKAGYVYILVNRAMPGMVKIGSTKLPPEERARQLSTTGVPAPFQVIAFHEFEDELRAERELHALFSQHRVHSRREFFDISIEEAQTALLRLSDPNAHGPASASRRASASPTLPANNKSTREGEKKRFQIPTRPCWDSPIGLVSTR
jgi:hypothetical protein